MLARSIEISHPYFRSSRAGKSANGSAQSVGRISRRRNPPIAAPEQPSGGLRFANPPLRAEIETYVNKKVTAGRRPWSPSPRRGEGGVRGFGSFRIKLHRPNPLNLSFSPLGRRNGARTLR
jgi:hypothetical protein